MNLSGSLVFEMIVKGVNEFNLLNPGVPDATRQSHLTSVPQRKFEQPSPSHEGLLSGHFLHPGISRWGRPRVEGRGSRQLQEGRGGGRETEEIWQLYRTSAQSGHT